MSTPICHKELYPGWAADSYFFDINHRLERVPRTRADLKSQIPGWAAKVPTQSRRRRVLCFHHQTRSSSRYPEAAVNSRSDITPTYSRAGGTTCREELLRFCFNFAFSSSSGNRRILLPMEGGAAKSRGIHVPTAKICTPRG
jgi:hypothetical protein